MFQEPNYHDAISGFGHANYRGLDNELGGTIRGATFTEPYTSNQTRRPFQALNLNEPNLTPFKLWYRESYANMEERSQGLYSTFPDRYTMVACASMFNYVYNDQAILENSLTGFDWRVDNVGSAPDYRDDINY